MKSYFDTPIDEVVYLNGKSDSAFDKHSRYEVIEALKGAGYT